MGDECAAIIINCPATATVQCASAVPATDFSGGSTSGGWAPVSVAFVSDVMSGSNCPNHFTLTRTYKAADANGNTATCAQTISVNDTIAPSATQDSIAACYHTVAAANAAALDATTDRMDNCPGVTLSVA